MTPEVVRITTSDVARLANVKSSTVRRWVETGALKPVIITPGGHYRFDRAEVERVLQAQPEEGTQPEREEYSVS
jgi:excisionase family DNA binding protein